ncbi:MAG: hypothetical protein EPN56_09150 [Rhodanobacter sp.]|nr:MAG: hypothetical protein EPN78_05505 [Rhodanobacter sp.]TAM13526.1 MAG: hypothetical protein EPN66_04435 [Rhodanobacter sp.]TAM35721.1 MAG: hypothetical protein EPN56_09150 [Rhodanobacter sp.]
MPRLLRYLALVLLASVLVACGKPRKSVFPPTLSVQQLVVAPNGMWHLTLRIQNNSYAGMDFTALDGQLQVAELVPLRLHATFQRDIPAFASDVVPLDVLPTPPMVKALAAVAAKGSAGALGYRIDGSTTAKPEQQTKPREFPFSGHDWLSPVPGVANTFR